MKTNDQTYRDRKQAERMTALRSRNAHSRGELSQYAVRQLGPSAFVGGPSGELERRFPNSPIIAQWSAGYRY
jgi:hypothetical protein